MITQYMCGPEANEFIKAFILVTSGFGIGFVTILIFIFIRKY